MEKSEELEKAIRLVKESGYKVAHPISFSGKRYIHELIELVENAGYRIYEAKAIDNNDEWTHKISLVVYPVKILEDLERKGEF